MTTATAEHRQDTGPGSPEPPYEPGTEREVDPRKLVFRNIREGRPSPGLIESVRQRGLLTKPSAVIGADGRLIVRLGERRTRAAIEAGREKITVSILGHDSAETDAEIARIIDQREENRHRQDLTAEDDFNTIEQLSLCGMSAEDIEKQAMIGRDRVDAALTLAKSPTGKTTAANKEFEQLDVIQLVALDEFADDPEAMRELAESVQADRFEHVLQDLRRRRQDEEKKAATTAQAKADGYTIVDRPFADYDDKTILPLSRLTDKDGKHFTPEQHAKCPGRVAWLGYPPGFTLTEGCTGWSKHGHRDSQGRARPRAADLSPEERAKQKAHRKLVIGNNRAWESAEEVRHRWIVTHLAKSKTEPKGAARFLAEALARDSAILNENGADRLAAEWTGTKTPPYGRADMTPAKSATNARCMVLAVLQVIAAYEVATTRNSWREDGTGNSTGRLLRYLSSLGYPLAEVEEFAISETIVAGEPA